MSTKCLRLLSLDLFPALRLSLTLSHTHPPLLGQTLYTGADPHTHIGTHRHTHTHTHTHTLTHTRLTELRGKKLPKAAEGSHQRMSLSSVLAFETYYIT